jgi:nitrogen fixation/metabolism regulation signal transduction histidine kinase
VLPIVILAVYNQQEGKNRSDAAIFTELSKRSDYLENHVRAQKQKHIDRDLIKAFDNAGKELGISFAIYEVSHQLYNSREEFYNTRLFNKKLNSKAHYNLNYLSYREYLTNETINNFIYDAYYRKVTIEGRPLIIGVNDAFNKIKLSYSTVNVDVFLFGVYSFALIIIIIISTVFANQISAPIRRLTKATESVAQGDLSVRLENNEKGELKDLFDGFESMTSELQKNQVEIAELERENAWKEMARQVAHEIKNPLTPMKLSIQQMVAAHKDKRKDFGSLFVKLAHSVLNQIDNLSLIASEFSTFAKMPSINLEVVELVPIVNDTINLFTDERINFSIKIPDAPILIEADKSQLRRMAINLIRNSIQAEATSIDIEISENENVVSIRIKDNGNGIDEENKSKIFKPNFTTKDKGMGLGLKLTKRFLQRLNGNIQLIESSPAGTTFAIIIPLHQEKTNPGT